MQRAGGSYFVRELVETDFFTSLPLARSCSPMSTFTVSQWIAGWCNRCFLADSFPIYLFPGSPAALGLVVPVVRFDLVTVPVKAHREVSKTGLDSRLMNLYLRFLYLQGVYVRITSSNNPVWPMPWAGGKAYA